MTTSVATEATVATAIEYRIDIRADAATVWRTLTETGVPRSWMWGSMIESDYAVGRGYSMAADGFDLIVGTVLANEPTKALRMTFDPRWDELSAAEPAGELSYTLEERENGSTRLTVTISGLGPESRRSVVEDTPEIYSGLKSFLETGEAL